jgi:hypothetical protein
MKHCLYCGKKKVFATGDFCSSNCCGKWKYENNESYRENHRKESKKYYLSVKNNPKYKKEIKTNFDNWIKKPKNKLRFNERALIANKKMYNTRKELGICAQCGNELDNKTLLSCNRCLLLDRLYAKRSRDIRRKIGVCTECGGKREDKNFVICLKCRIKMRKYAKLKRGKKNVMDIEKMQLL